MAGGGVQGTAPSPSCTHQPVPAQRPVAQSHRQGLSREERRNDADAHLKRAAETGYTLQIMGGEVVTAVTKGRLDLSTWEQVFHGEFAPTEVSAGSEC